MADEQPVEVSELEPVQWHYCLEENCPGCPPLQSNPLCAGRFFEFSTGEAPVVCPHGREVTAASVPGQDIPPPGIVELANRIG